MAEADRTAPPPPPAKRTSKRSGAAAKEGAANAPEKSTSNAKGKKNTTRADIDEEQRIIDEKLASPESLEYICVSRPWEDRNREWMEDEDFDEEPSKKEIKRCEKENKQVAKKLSADCPDWPWIVTRMGNYLVNTYRDEAERRDQDNFGMYIYNDFSGYGPQEVIENQLVAFNEVFNKKDYDPHRLWILLEAVAFWLTLLIW